MRPLINHLLQNSTSRPLSTSSPSSVCRTRSSGITRSSSPRRASHRRAGTRRASNRLGAWSDRPGLLRGDAMRDDIEGECNMYVRFLFLGSWVGGGYYHRVDDTRYTKAKVKSILFNSTPQMRRMCRRSVVAFISSTFV